MITYFKEKKSRKRYKIYKTANTILESVDSIVFIGATSISKTLSVTCFGLIILPISAGLACAPSLSNKVLHKIISNKHNKYKKPYEKDQLTTKSFDKLNRKSLQDNIIDITEYESLWKIFTQYVDENKNESFFINVKIKKTNCFSNNELEFQPRT